MRVFRQLPSTFLGVLLGCYVTAAAGAEIIEVETRQTPITAVIGGVVIPFAEVTLTAQTSGRVEFIAGVEGDKFDKGAVLARIDNSELMAQRHQAVAQLAQADAGLRNAFARYNLELVAPQRKSPAGGMGGMGMSGMGMPALFDQVFTRHMGDAMGYGDPGLERQTDLYNQASLVNQAQAQVAAAHSSIAQIDAQLSDTASIAAFDGVILNQQAEVGDTVQPGQPLITFGHTKYLRIEAEVPVGLVRYLKVGSEVPGFVDIANDRIQTRVAQIFPLADPDRHTVTVKFDLPLGVEATPGMYAEVILPAAPPDEAPKAIVIPRSAVVQVGSLPGVLVVENGTSKLRTVRLGTQAGSDQVEVLSGLKPGDQIINNPPPGANSGWMPPKEQAPKEKGENKAEPTSEDQAKSKSGDQDKP